MRSNYYDHLFKFIKVALISFSAAFLMLSLPSCTLLPSLTQSNHSEDSTPRILSSHQTHALLTKWSANSYQSLPRHTITYTSHHPLATKSEISAITSGYTISPLTRRTKGIGLASLIKIKSPKDFLFTPITKDTYLTNLQPANLVATQTKQNGQRTTHIDIYHPLTSKHQGQALAYQPKLVMNYINDLPGNSTLSIKGLIKPNKYDKHQGFYLAEPYDKKRIPIIMIHGLISSPETFMDMAETINADPELRKKYQIWYYFYPTGTPWIVTSSEFRKSYRNLIQTIDPNHNDSNIRKTIIIGHSMGGLIARVSLSQPKEILHQAYLGDAHPSDIFSASEQAKIHDYFHYSPLTEPAKVIYLATPHRGSKIADGLIGWFAIKIITIPSFILQQTADVLTLGQLAGNNLPDHTKKLLSTGESSVNQLQPSNPSLIALNRMPLRKNIASYSIIGDIGKPILELETDGVVSYHSAHLNFSKAEFIVPANHDICGQKDAINAVIQILKN
ncbi:MAG: esterase/lipase family protein [Akkermansiaceae bacterium]